MTRAAPRTWVFAKYGRKGSYVIGPAGGMVVAIISPRRDGILREEYEQLVGRLERILNRGVK